MTLEEWAGQAYVAAHLSPCFEPETDDDAGWEAVAKKETDYSVSAIAEIIRAAIAEERQACARAICSECADGWPFDDEGHHRAPEGHWPPFAHCLAGPILARGQA